MKTGPDQILSSCGIEISGVCRFADALPLISCRAQARLPRDAHSILVCLFPYRVNLPGPRNVARYAAVTDYHDVAGGMLEQAACMMRVRFANHAFVPFVDNSPIREVCAATLAGLGTIGRHGQILHERYGPWVFIGEIVTTLDLAPDRPSRTECSGCNACIRACPTGALTADGFEKDRCRSFLTQKKRDLSAWEEEQIRAGGLIWGCDLCLEACPTGHHAALSPIAAFHRDPCALVTPDNVDALLPRMAWGYRGRQVLLRNYDIVRKNHESLQE